MLHRKLAEYFDRIEQALMTLRNEQELLGQLTSTDAVLWSPQVDRSGVQALSDLLETALLNSQRLKPPLVLQNPPTRVENPSPRRWTSYH